MGSYPANMAARAGNPSRRLFYAVRMDLPASPLLSAKTLRLLDGSAVLNFLGGTWVGQDGDYGSWRGAQDLEEQLATESPRLSITLAPLSDAAQQQIAAPGAQNAPVTIYGGELDVATGAVVSDPEVLFYGAIDTGNIQLGRNSRSLTLDVMAATELMFLSDAAATLSSSWHNQFFPAELGFVFVGSVQHTVPWGAKGPRPDQATNARNYDTDRGGGRTRLRF